MTKTRKIVFIYLCAFVLLLVAIPRQGKGPADPGWKPPLQSPQTHQPAAKQPLNTSPAPPAKAPLPAPSGPVSVPPSEPASGAAEPVPTVDGHPNYPYQALLSPNDGGYGSQWYSARENASAAWGITTGSSQTVIAIIDTGFSLNHQDLAGRWWTNPGEIGPTASQGPAPNCTSRGLALDKSCNNLDNDGDGYASDWRGWDFANSDNDPSAGSTDPNSSAAFHGTYVAGLTAATGNNGVGYAGVDWNARIMPLQALADNGNGFTNTIAAAVRYAADHGADVINLSLGSQYDDTYLRSQIDYAISRGVTVVAAAGNDGCDCMLYPANYSEVVAVGASDQGDNRASFSSYGANLDLVAPGAGGICAPYYTPANPTSGYSCGGQGTSFAAPQVSGAVALMVARNPGITPDSVEKGLRSAADKTPGMAGAAFQPAFGFGRLNLYNALVQATTPVQLPGTDSSKPTTVSISGSDATTVCQASGVTCQLRLTGPSGQIVYLPAATPDQWGDATIYWSPRALGLVAGTWQVDSLNAFGVVTPYAHETITLTP